MSKFVFSLEKEYRSRLRQIRDLQDLIIPFKRKLEEEKSQYLRSLKASGWTPFTFVDDDGNKEGYMFAPRVLIIPTLDERDWYLWIGTLVEGEDYVDCFGHNPQDM